MSAHPPTLSLPAIILININVMLGLGIFINSVPLAQFAGALGAAVYAIIGIIMMPLIMATARLLKLHPGGSFYLFGSKELSPFWGFLSTWSYATGKLASATLMIHFFSSIIANIFPVIGCIGVIPLDVAIIILFTWLNLQNMHTGRKIQFTFLTLKSLPILFVLLVGFACLCLYGGNFTGEHLIVSGLPSALPLAIYSFLGFEVSCALSQHIVDSERNAPRAVYYSYGLVVIVACLFQFIMYGVLGTNLANATDYTQALPLFVNHIIASDAALPYIKLFFLLAIAISAIGGAYGILFSNTWNMNALAHHGHLFYSRLASKLNIHQIPTGCVILQAFICLGYLALTRGYNVPLQYITAFGGVIAYMINVISLLRAEWRTQSAIGHRIIGFLALINCLILLVFCINGFIAKSVTHYLAVFVAILIAGIAMFWYRLKKEPNYLA